MPSLIDMSKFYTKNYFKGGSQGVKGYKDYSLLEDCLIVEAKKKITLIEKYREKGLLLDVGAGTGVFLKIAQLKGYKIKGNDISPFAIKHLRDRKISCYPGPIGKNIFPKEKFDLITAWDVIEHITNPRQIMNALNYALKKGGYLFLTTPNTASFDAKIFGWNWYGYKKIPEHVLFFNKNSINKLLNSTGFESLEIIPWGFVRNLEFIFTKVGIGGVLLRAMNRLLKLSGLSNIYIFFPVVDFLVVARKVKYISG